MKTKLLTKDDRRDLGREATIVFYVTFMLVSYQRNGPLGAAITGCLVLGGGALGAVLGNLLVAYLDHRNPARRTRRTIYIYGQEDTN